MSLPATAVMSKAPFPMRSSVRGLPSQPHARAWARTGTAQWDLLGSPCLWKPLWLGRAAVGAASLPRGSARILPAAGAAAGPGRWEMG